MYVPAVSRYPDTKNRLTAGAYGFGSLSIQWTCALEPKGKDDEALDMPVNPEYTDMQRIKGYGWVKHNDTLFQPMPDKEARSDRRLGCWAVFV
jgi:hypothetical protein